MEEGKKYCLCCGEDVPYNVVVRNERRELTCSYCGFTLDIENLWEDTKSSVNTYALIAEDSKFTRTLLKELILKKAITSEVMAVTNGLELISEYTKLLKRNVRVSFAIIDLNMPVMDGLTAARTLRALEDKDSIVKVPIVFFSGVKADEGLRRQMELLAPANYVNKGTDTDPENLVKRVQGLLSFISQHYQSS
ncbi:MAG: response regulator [Nitrospirota bacterium]|nr:response regulator [Nitrospirota bacterium]